MGVAGTLGAYGGTVVVAMVWRLVGQGLREQPVNYLRDIAATILLATWVPLFASFTSLMIFQPNGGGRVFTVIATVVFADIGGYIAGVLFGKHRWRRRSARRSHGRDWAAHCCSASPRPCCR